MRTYEEILERLEKQLPPQAGLYEYRIASIEAAKIYARQFLDEMDQYNYYSSSRRRNNILSLTKQLK